MEDSVVEEEILKILKSHKKSKRKSLGIGTLSMELNRVLEDAIGNEELILLMDEMVGRGVVDEPSPKCYWLI